MSLTSARLERKYSFGSSCLSKHRYVLAKRNETTCLHIEVAKTNKQNFANIVGIIVMDILDFKAINSMLKIFRIPLKLKILERINLFSSFSRSIPIIDITIMFGQRYKWDDRTNNRKQVENKRLHFPSENREWRMVFPRGGSCYVKQYCGHSLIFRNLEPVTEKVQSIYFLI